MSGHGYFDGPISLMGGKSDEATVLALALATACECMEKKAEDSSPVLDMVATTLHDRRKRSGQNRKMVVQAETVTIVRIKMWPVIIQANSAIIERPIDFGCPPGMLSVCGVLNDVSSWTSSPPCLILYLSSTGMTDSESKAVL